MAVVVAGYFSSEADATHAMDQVLTHPEFGDVESEVISTVARGTGNVGDAEGGIAPVFPQTSGGISGAGFGGVPMTGGGGRRLFSDLDDEEAEYFSSALDGGGVLALIKVDENKAHGVRQILSQNGARVYQEK